MPTTAIFRRTDGIFAWQVCVEQVSPKTENIDVQGSHFGVGHNRQSFTHSTIASPEPKASGGRSTAPAGALLYPDPNC